jgi:hypothetical protein
MFEIGDIVTADFGGYYSDFLLMGPWHDGNGYEGLCVAGWHSPKAYTGDFWWINLQCSKYELVRKAHLVEKVIYGCKI